VDDSYWECGGTQWVAHSNSTHLTKHPEAPPVDGETLEKVIKEYVIPMHEKDSN
jgi:hypothetical protein